MLEAFQINFKLKKSATSREVNIKFRQLIEYITLTNMIQKNWNVRYRGTIILSKINNAQELLCNYVIFFQ